MKKTPQETPALSIEQDNAVDWLVQGLSDREVSEKVGVSRATVCDWRNHNAVFQASLNRRRADLFAEGADRLRTLVGRAVGVLGAGLDSQDERIRQSAALAVLKTVGLAEGGARPTGPTSDAEIRHQKMLEDVINAGY